LYSVLCTSDSVSIIFQTLDLHYAPYSVLHSCSILYSCTCSALFRLCFRLCSVMCFYTVLYSALQDPLLCPLLALSVSRLHYVSLLLHSVSVPTLHSVSSTLFLYLLFALVSDLLCISVSHSVLILCLHLLHSALHSLHSCSALLNL
jgi:hypothetical protein